MCEGREQSGRQSSVGTTAQSGPSHPAVQSVMAGQPGQNSSSLLQDITSHYTYVFQDLRDPRYELHDLRYLLNVPESIFQVQSLTDGQVKNQFLYKYAGGMGPYYIHYPGMNHWSFIHKEYIWA